MKQDDKRRREEALAMMGSVDKIFADITGGKTKIQWGPSEDLNGYRRGRALTNREVRELSDKKVPVWVYCKASDEERPRSDGPFWVENYNPTTRDVGLGDGSSFAHDMELGPDDQEAVDEKHGWGTLRVFEAKK